MEAGELMTEGVSLMLLGMGTVFTFLTILVFVTTFMSTLIQKYSPSKPVVTTRTENIDPMQDQTLVAVITAAIHAHRSRK